MKTCCIISQPIANFPFGCNEEDERCLQRKAAFEHLADALIETQGVTHFMSDLSLGFPLYAAELLLAAKERHPQITLECVLPYETQTETWAENFRDRYFAVCEHTDKETMLQRRYTPGCEDACVRYMIGRADIVLAFSPDLDICDYARAFGKEVVRVDVPSSLT